MANIKCLDLTGKQVKDVAIDSALLVESPNRQAMFDCVLAETSAERQGTHSTLTKGEVRGGGKKPWRQKHTGRARTGSIRNPQWVGGGIVFGPKPNRNYKIKVNKSVQRLAMRSVLTDKLNRDSLFALVNDAALTKPSTKAMAAFIKAANFEDKKVLIIVDKVDNNIIKSTNNLPKVITKLWNQVSVRDLMFATIVIAMENTFESYKGKIA